MDLPVEIASAEDANGINRFPSTDASNSPLRVVAFHYFDQHHKELIKWTKLIDQFTEEYAGRIKFELKDIKTIGTFHSSLSPDDFGSFRANVPPRLFGMDNDDRIYTMHMLFSYKYIKDFCEKLLQGKLFEAVVLGSQEEFDLPPQNYYQLEAHSKKDLFVMFYDPSCYYWFLQIAKLRKLSKLLALEDVDVVIINRGHNYLGVDFDKWSKLNSFHGVTTFATKRPNGWISNQSDPQDSTRGYLNYIALHRNPELREYDRNGDAKYPEQTLEDIELMFKKR